MLGFFVAFAVKLPVVPLHGWLPDAHSQAPTAGSVDLAGLLLKTAAYGLLRFALPLFPEASASFAPVAMWLGLGGIFYGAFQAFAQTDIKRMVAYTSISHMGYVLIGIYAGTAMALQGTVVQMIAHGLSASALFILCGQLYERLHTRDLREMGGLWARLPWLPAMAMFFAAASLGLPGTGNFIGEFLILAGSYAAAPLVVALATGGLVFASAYSLALVHRSMFGPARSDTPIAGRLAARTGDASQPGRRHHRAWHLPAAGTRHGLRSGGAGAANPCATRQPNPRERATMIGSQHFLALSPLLITVATAIVVMISVSVRRHHFFNATLTVIGLNAALLATFVAREQIPGVLAITGLLVHDQYSLFGTCAVLVSTLGCATLCHAYLEGLNDNREEMYLMLLIAACRSTGAGQRATPDVVFHRARADVGPDIWNGRVYLP